MTIHGVTPAWHTFGLREDAQQGIDDCDVYEPPIAPGESFRPCPSMNSAWMRASPPAGLLGAA